jgi:hypothetical protein
MQKIVSILSLVIVGVWLLAGCSKPEEGPSTQPAVKAPPAVAGEVASPVPAAVTPAPAAQAQPVSVQPVAAAPGAAAVESDKPISAAVPTTQTPPTTASPTAAAAPAAEAQPQPGVVTILVLGDKRCTDPTCDTRQLLNSLKVMLPNATVTELDWGTPEGRAAIEDHGLSLLPAFVFDASLQTQPEAVSRLSRFLQPSKKTGFQTLQIRASHDPSKEICDNNVDDTGNGKVDCDDDHCKSSLTCRPEIKGDLQVFVMSQCPFGVKALDAMAEVLKAFGADIQFDVHFIANEQGDGFQALHGQPEVDENIRQLCARKLAPENYKWMDYIWCRNKNIRSAAYETCVTASGMDLETFNSCANGDEGKQLLRDDIRLAQALGIGGSPSWLVNNKVQFSGLDPRSIQTNICQANPGLSGCGAQLTGPAPRDAGGGCGCGGGGGGGGSCGGR